VTTTILLGILVAFVATTLAAAYRRAPTRTLCPACGEKTESVQAPFWIRKAAPDLSVRWCPDCSWEGVGRAGPEWVPGHPAAHGSGFFWGDDRFPVDFGFRFAAQPDPPGAAPSEPPAHPSGFRFSATDPPTGQAHPSGFTWSDGGPAEGADTAAAPTPQAPPVFLWAEPPIPQGFAWRSAGKTKQGPPAFQWKA
jgi:hypothetical protein